VQEDLANQAEVGIRVEPTARLRLLHTLSKGLGAPRAQNLRTLRHQNRNLKVSSQAKARLTPKWFEATVTSPARETAQSKLSKSSPTKSSALCNQARSSPTRSSALEFQKYQQEPSPLLANPKSASPSTSLPSSLKGAFTEQTI